MRTVAPIEALIGSESGADKRKMQRRHERDAYQALLWGETLLLALLGAALALFLAHPTLRTTAELPELRLFFDTGIVLAAALVAVLAGIRFTIEGQRRELLLLAGFASAAAGGFAFAVLPAFDGSQVGRETSWAALAAGLAATALIAAAPFARGRVRSRAGLWTALFGVSFLLTGLWLGCAALGGSLPSLSSGDVPMLFVWAVAGQALLSLIAVIGFGLRFRAVGEDLDRWLALASTLGLFAELHFVFTPTLSSGLVSQGDFLRLLSYGVLLAGVWRAIRFAEFGRAVAEERARVAREIHDGLAQYLFAISTHLQMLDQGSPLQKTLPRLKEAASAAQQEARFAVLALSSASGNAPFGAALSRYVEFLTADGVLDVELEIDEVVELAPDEQIEVFRIVQEGLANVRKHAHARRAWVTIDEQDGKRVVRVRDDGAGFEEESDGAGQGLKNMQARSASIGGGFSVRSRPGLGTAVEVTLRAY
jgi:signal transduction histidine kinase